MDGSRNTSASSIIFAYLSNNERILVDMIVRSLFDVFELYDAERTHNSVVSFRQLDTYVCRFRPQAVKHSATVRERQRQMRRNEERELRGTLSVLQYVA